MATATEANRQSNISATTSAFALRGGRYMCAASATWGGGTVKLQVLGPDDSTYLDLPTGTSFTANGTAAALDLPPGQYRVNVATATAVYFSVVRIPT